MDLCLKGKNVLVTGGSRGIGKAIVQQFLEEGANVSFCSRGTRDLEDASDLLASSFERSRFCATILDVNCHDDLQEWVEKSNELFGSIDVVVSNVSAQSFEWEPSLQTDILSTVKLVNTVLPHLRGGKGSAIVGIISKAALLSVPSYKPYSAVKAALLSYFSSLSVELASENIRVNSVSPGEVQSEGGVWERIKNEDEDFYNTTISKNPFGRFATPAEVANAVVFLASSRASYISGTNLLVDGAGREGVQF